MRRAKTPAWRSTRSPLPGFFPS
ncbi:ORFL196W.iORF2 [Human betaherpesvirus 5]|nr:ORFL196W.iORF2 [Human betaherpesvirus 5]QHX40544.1 ORFL196W.iORF2 [Human betaherpesvirus 5]